MVIKSQPGSCCKSQLGSALTMDYSIYSLYGVWILVVQLRKNKLF
jgi:hypothetical protein